MYIENRAEFAEFTMTFFKSVAAHGAGSKYQVLCKNAYPEYTGGNPCAHNVARSFITVKHFLETNVSAKKEDWIWGRVHVKSFDHLPWSKTPLKFLYHRSVPYGGNENTVNVSIYFKSKNYSQAVISSIGGANYKQII